MEHWDSYKFLIFLTKPLLSHVVVEFSSLDGYNMCFIYTGALKK